MTFNFKELLLGILAAASSIVVFWLWYRTVPRILTGEFESYSTFLMPVVGLIVAASLFSLTALLVKSSWIVYPAGALGTGIPYFFLPMSLITGSVLVASILLILFAQYLIHKEFLLSFGFNLFKFLRGGLPIFFTLASLLVAVFYLEAVGGEEKILSTLLPRPAFRAVLKGLSGPLPPLMGLPITSFDATIDESLVALLRDELQSQNVSFSQLPQKELDRLIARQRAELAKNLGLTLTGDERMADVFYHAVTRRLEELLGPYRRYVPYASAIAFFFAFKTFTVPFYYASLLITFLLIKFMLFIKVLRSERMEVEVERLTL